MTSDAEDCRRYAGLLVEEGRCGEVLMLVWWCEESDDDEEEEEGIEACGPEAGRLGMTETSQEEGARNKVLAKDEN